MKIPFVFCSSSSWLHSPASFFFFSFFLILVFRDYNNHTKQTKYSKIQSRFSRANGSHFAFILLLLLHSCRLISSFVDIVACFTSIADPIMIMAAIIATKQTRNETPIRAGNCHWKHLPLLPTSFSAWIPPTQIQIWIHSTCIMLAGPNQRMLKPENALSNSNKKKKRKKKNQQTGINPKQQQSHISASIRVASRRITSHCR